MALWLRDWAEHPAGPQGLVHRSDARSQCTSLSFTTALIQAAGMDSSIGTVGDFDHPCLFRPSASGC